LEAVKKIKDDSSWLPTTRGKAFKMVSQLLYDLPSSERYRILFMQRNLEEILLSQEAMLQRLGRPAAPREKIRSAFLLHLDKLHAWLPRQENMLTCRVSYNDLVEDPLESSRQISQFLGDVADAEKMAATVDSSLYRNRS
jgi:hypothetical protein